MFTTLVLFVSLIGAPAMTYPDQHVTSTVSYKQDPRYQQLKAYLYNRQSPAAALSADFIAAADRYSLDWRLLPAISVMESGGGQRYKNNNILGWASCEVRFPTVRHGIHYVAARLAESELYRSKSTDEKLRLYNPYRSYPRRVKQIMRAIGPAPSEAASSLDSQTPSDYSIIWIAR